MDPLARKLILLVPPIRRSRGFRLYARDGRRFLDLWQDGGAGILGSRHAGIVNALKSSLEAGRHLGLPSDELPRARKTLLALFPGFRSALSYASARAAREAHPRAAEWRPFLPLPDADELIILPPLPSWMRPAFALAKTALRAEGFPLPSSMQLSAALKSLAALRREESSGTRQAGWLAFDAASRGAFTREGPYLRPREGTDYEALFRAALSRGALLSPDPASPSIIPGEFSPGELSFLREETP